MARTDSASFIMPQPACEPFKVHGPPMAQQPKPKALTSIPERPNVRFMRMISFPDEMGAALASSRGAIQNRKLFSRQLNIQRRHVVLILSHRTGRHDRDGARLMMQQPRQHQ